MRISHIISNTYRVKDNHTLKHYNMKIRPPNAESQRRYNTNLKRSVDFDICGIGAKENT
jgi:hypothetical protein